MALRAIKVVELAGLAPGPFCGRILADFGASVLRVDRHLDQMPIVPDFLAAGKKSIALDLRQQKGAEILRTICSKNCDVLIDPFRPGVMEKFGLGPDILRRENPRLVYARLTGYGSEKCPFSDRAGHDINYVAMSGLLSTLGLRGECPSAPLNLLADFAGGGLTCALGIMLSLYERQTSGKGQVVDSSMVEGTAYIGSWIFKSRHDPLLWGQPRGQNMLDGGAHFYGTYRTKNEDEYMAVGAIEPKFYAEFIRGLGLELDQVPQFEPSKSRKKIAEAFALKTRADWTEIFEDLDACVTPVLSLEEAATHPHNVARSMFNVDAHGNFQPGPAPRLSGDDQALSNRSTKERASPSIGQNTEEVLLDNGYSQKDIELLIVDKVVSCS